MKFVPFVERVVEVKEEFGSVYWTLETDRGPREIIVRNLRDSTSSFDRDLASRVRLVDSRFAPVQVEEAFDGDWATAVAPLEPGGYALRVDPKPASPGVPTLPEMISYLKQALRERASAANPSDRVVLVIPVPPYWF